MARILRVLSINFVILTLFIFILEIFLKSAPPKLVKNSNSIEYSYKNQKLTRSELLQKYGESILRPIPINFLYNLNPVFQNLNENHSYELKYIPHSRGNLNRKNIKYIGLKKFKGIDEPLYKVSYDFDSFGRRVVSTNCSKKKIPFFIATFGDSFTFGEGLSEKKTYPSQLAEKLNCLAHVYNYGYHGYGPNDWLDEATVNTSAFDTGIIEKSGIFIWLFIPDHLNRFFCSWYCYREDYSWMLNKHKYIYHDGSFTKSVSFEEDYSLSGILKRLTSKSTLLKALITNPYATYTNDDYNTFVKALVALSNKLKNRKIIKKYFIVFNTWNDDSGIISAAKENGFDVLEFGEITNSVEINHPFLSSADKHPSSETTWYLSEMLKNRIILDLQHLK